MKEAFKNISPTKDTVEVIAKANQIINQYLSKGLKLSLRQLYYQFVSRNWLPNTERSYKNLSTAVSKGRLIGALDWDAIEDRGRQPYSPTDFNDLNELVENACHWYRLPRWEGQENYVELWVEKDALSGVLRPLASKYHVTLMVNKGYSSQSAMYEASKRFINACESTGKAPYLLYLGDLDPSGEDMVRDVTDRLRMFGVNADEGTLNYDLTVTKVALTMDLVEEHNPPPNPAKMTDPRAGDFVDKHGTQSWEVDALPPEVLQELVSSAIEDLLDKTKYEKIIAKEELDKKALKDHTAKLTKKLKKSEE